MAEPFTALITSETCKQIVVPMATAIADWFRPTETITVEWRGPDFKETKWLGGLLYHSRSGSSFTYTISGKRGFCVEASKYVSQMIQAQINGGQWSKGGSVLLNGPSDLTGPIKALPSSAAKVIDV